MAEDRAADNIGPHLLGRKSHEAEPGDWSMERALTEIPTPDPTWADKTVRELREGGMLSSWSQMRAFWKWVKEFFGPPPTSPTPAGTTKTWTDLVVLDQGQTGHCVGFGTSGYLASEPVQDQGIDNRFGHDLYYWIKANIDNDPGAEDGSTVHAAAKALVAKGRIKSYVWASSVSAMRTWVLSQGPVIMGTDWDNDMFDPDSRGYVKPGGGVAGGHCYLLVGYDAPSDTFTFVNSWGTSWADGGRFHMTTADFETLWARRGNEAMAALELPLT